MTEERARILIVDDEPFNVDYLEQELEDLDCDTVSAQNGREALEQVAAEGPDVILLDIMMPGTSGYSVLKTIKENEKFKHILVVLFTVKSFNEDIQKGKKLGADGYLTKPFSGKELLKYVQEKLTN